MYFLMNIALARKYSQVIQRYHIEYLNGADTMSLSQHIEVRERERVYRKLFFLKIFKHQFKTFNLNVFSN